MNSYDIFISYRRVDSAGRVSGRDIARTLQKELQLRKYRVFFDYSEIRDNEFDHTIIPAIRSSRVFILLLTRDALLRCANTGDWVHREILEALQSGLKIIPVNPDCQFNGWPTNLPTDISSIKTIQISEIATNSLFETSIDKLETDRIKPVIFQSRGTISTNAFSFNFSAPSTSSPHTSKGTNPSAISVKKPAKRKVTFMEKMKDWLNGEGGERLLIIVVSFLVIIPGLIIWTCSNTDNDDAVSIIEQNGKAGLVFKGDTILPCEYDSIWSFSGAFNVFKDNKEGWVSEEGVMVIPCEFKSIRSSGSFLYVEDDNGYNHLYNKIGEKLTKKPYRFIWYGYNCDFGKVQDLDYKYGYIDSLGNEVIACKYFSVSEFYEGKAFVKMSASETMKCIDKTEQVLFTTPYHNAYSYSEGLAYVSDYSVGGFIDEQGHLVIPMKYGMIKNENGWYTTPAFHNGSAPVSFDGVSGRVDRQGNFTPDE